MCVLSDDLTSVQTSVAGAHCTDSHMLSLNVIVSVLQPGWYKVITLRVQSALFCSYRYFQKHPEPPYVYYEDFCALLHPD